MATEKSKLIKHSLRIVLGLLLAFVSVFCRKEFDTSYSDGNLLFSTDTLHLDTLFTRKSSSTYILKVYNSTNEELRIPEIVLDKAENSSFRININGSSAISFTDVPIMSKDSLYIFVEATVDTDQLGQQGGNNELFQYEDRLLFVQGDQQQSVLLSASVINATTFYPSKDQDGIIQKVSLGVNQQGNNLEAEGFEFLDNQLYLSGSYLIYGYGVVPSGKTLVIAPGSKLYFHEGAGIFVREGGRLEVQGGQQTNFNDRDNPVVFTSDRFEVLYAGLQGQWNGIWFDKGTFSNRIENAIIENSKIGILLNPVSDVNNTVLTLKNVQIYNQLNAGILARHSSIKAENLVINYAQNAFYVEQGGKYDLNHCSFANYYSTSGVTSKALTLIDQDNYDLDFKCFNSIVFGSSIQEIDIRSTLDTSHCLFDHCLLRIGNIASLFQVNPNYDYTDISKYNNCIFNQSPRFLSPNSINDLRIDAFSVANGNAISSSLVEDMIGETRDQIQPDIGAYEVL